MFKFKQPDFDEGVAKFNRLKRLAEFNSLIEENKARAEFNKEHKKQAQFDRIEIKLDKLLEILGSA